MTSSAVTGERRWASSRRSGMTVLGKVSVPKPINLPSQKSENHGLDPNVEIVPKGTTIWGSRPSSSSASNAWGSSTLSSNTDGATCSPSYLSGRPSSGESVTRPSTSGSDRAHESSSNAWGPNSRPSSDSGMLTSNHSLTILRPRSAEPRPGSSHLSRLAESSSENSVAWGGPGTLNKLGVTSSRKDGFSLISGDFPTLGSDKNNPEKESRGNVSGNSIEKSGVVNTWKNENYPYDEDIGGRHGSENFQNDPQQYMGPQHFDGWHGVPMGMPPGGCWYRGPPGGPPYGAPMQPGNFSLEPFPYYHPQMPGPRGHHSLPDAYIRPGMPIRPGFYPGPVPYESFYTQQMSYCNPNERDMPFMGMPSGPVYNMYSGQNTQDNSNPHGRNDGHDFDKTLAPEQVEFAHPHDSRGPSKIIVKHHKNAWNGQDEEHRLEYAIATNTQQREIDNHRRTSWDDDWEPERRTITELPSQNFDQQQDYVSAPSIQMSLSNTFDAKVGSQVYPLNPKESTLIQKIEGLNAKAWSEGHHDDSSVSHREVQNSRSSWLNSDSKVVTSDAHVLGVNSGGNSHETTGSTGSTRGGTHGRQGRLDYRGKGKINTLEVDEWPKKHVAVDSSNVSLATRFDVPSNPHNQVMHISTEATDRFGTDFQGRDEGESAMPIFDPGDLLVQRAKMRELAIQKAKQREKEEEERTKEQKAKARAKLEELDRRTQAVEGDITQNTVDISSESTVLLTESGPINLKETEMDSSKPDVGQISNSNVFMVGKSAILSRELPLETAKNALEEPVALPNQSFPAEQKRINNSSDGKSFHARNGVPKQKRSDNKYKQNIKLEKSLADVSISTSSVEGLKIHTNVVVDVSSSAKAVSHEVSSTRDPSLPINSSGISEPLPRPRRKNYRGGKTTQKFEETFSANVPELQIPKESSFRKPETSKLNVDFKDENRSLPGEEADVRVNTPHKPQNSRRIVKNPQVLREKLYIGDHVVWAPVQSNSTADVPVEVGQRNIVETDSRSTQSNPLVHNSPKSKRAEMERYVPKPVAMEIAQQDGIQQTRLDESTGNTENTLASKHAKGGSRKQRGSAESVYVEKLQDGNAAAIHLSKEQPHFYDGWNEHLDNYSEVADVARFPVKDEEVMGRGKQRRFKGHKNTRSNPNFDRKNIDTGGGDKTYTQVIESSQMDGGSGFKENRATGQRATSHWQPKSQGNTIHKCGQNIANEVGMVTSHADCGQTLGETSKTEESLNIGQQDSRKERKAVSFNKGRQRSPKRDVELVHEGVDIQHDQHPSLGFRKYGNQNNRFGGRVQDYRQRIQPENRERQGYNSRYEYHSVGPHNNNNTSSSDDRGSHVTGARDRVQTSSRRDRGNFYGSQGGRSYD